MEKGCEWVGAYVAAALKVIGYEDWDVTIAITDKPEIEGGFETMRVLGTYLGTPGYFLAKIELERAHVSEPTEDARRTVIHECLHVALAHYQHTANGIIRMLPKGSRRGVLSIMDAVLEQVIVKMSRGLLASVDLEYEAAVPATAHGDGNKVEG